MYGEGEADEQLTDIKPLICAGCPQSIFNTRTVISVRGKLYHDEECANRAALRRLRGR
jgi:hypothetical protein